MKYLLYLLLLIPAYANFYYLSLLPNENYNFTIHGLWPQNNKTSYPEYCRNVTFSTNVIEKLIPIMNQYWPSDENNTEFWEHEWEKHGSCMFNNADEYHYFNRTLGLYFEADYYKYIQHNCTLNEQCLLPLNTNFQFIT